MDSTAINTRRAIGAQSITRDPASITDLNLSFAMITYLNEFMFKDLVNLKVLLVNNNYLTKLDNFAKRLGQLERLDLSYNLIIRIPKGLFRNLHCLRELNLAFNSIASLKRNVFLGLKRLSVLYLNNNHICSLRNCLRYLVSLKLLNLNANLLYELKCGFFRNLVALEQLHLNNNDIRSIRGPVFARLRALQTLDLNTNQLQSVPDTHRLFHRNRLLTSLNLASSQLVFLSVTFQNFLSLQSLNISYNFINDEIFCWVFGNLPFLKTLTAAGLQLKHLTDQWTLRSSLILQTLYLQSNAYLISIGYLFFRRFTHLIELNLDGCNPNCVVDFRIFRTNFNLQILILSYVRCFNGYLPESLKQLKYSGNFIDESIPRFITDSQSIRLEQLTITKIGVKSLNANMFDNLQTLTKLVMTQLNLQYLTYESFAALVLLRELDLSENDLIILNRPIFQSVNSLRSLSIRCCKISRISRDFFEPLVHLNHLYLDANPLHELSATLFETLVELRILSLNNCQLRQLPERIFDRNGNLTEIYLNGNSFSASIEHCFKHLDRLVVLNVKVF